MYILHTEKQRKYFKEVVRLHYEEGYGEERISRILPIGHTTVSRWIAIFERNKGAVTKMAETTERDKERGGRQVPELSRTSRPEDPLGAEVEALRARVKELEARASEAEIRAEAYEEMIRIAEARFKIPIRKKRGAKQ